MSVDKIIDKILADARSDAQDALAQAQQRAAELAAELEKETDVRVERILAQAQSDAAEAHRSQRLVAELERRKRALALRREVLDEAFSQALMQLNTRSGQAWEDMITATVLRAAQTGEERLLAPAADRPAYEAGLLQRLNQALAAAGKPGALTLDQQNAHFAHGVALIGNTCDVDGSTEALLHEARARCEGRVAELLFGGREG
jgi:V/A-type H+-transporting ATPase subunit E